MSVESSIEETTEAIISALGRHDLSDEEKDQIGRQVSRLLLKTVEKTTENHIRAAASCCEHELDLAHKIQAEINRKKDALISNLKALR